MSGEISSSNEAISFLMFVLSGIASGFIYDFLKQAEKTFFKNDKKYFLCEPLIILSILIYTLFSFIKINNLDIKFYALSGLFFGFVLYFLIISRLISNIFKIFFIFFKKILKILLYPAHLSCIILKSVFMHFKKLCIFPVRKTALLLEGIFERIRKI